MLKRIPGIRRIAGGSMDQEKKSEQSEQNTDQKQNNEQKSSAQDQEQSSDKDQDEQADSSQKQELDALKKDNIINMDTTLRSLFQQNGMKIPSEWGLLMASGHWALIWRRKGL